MSRLTVKVVTVSITPADIELIRENARSLTESFYYRGEPDHKQPTEWHEGHTMLRLATRLTRAYRAARVATGKGE